MIFSVTRHISASRQKVHWQVLILLEEFCTSFWKNDTPARRINTLISKIVVVGLLKLTSSSTTKIMAYHKSYFQKYKVIRQIIGSHSNESNATLAGNRSMGWNKGPQNRATRSSNWSLTGIKQLNAAHRVLSTNSPGEAGSTKSDTGIHKNYIKPVHKFKCKMQTIRRPGDNTGKNLVHFGFHSRFLDTAPKAPSIRELLINKLY